MCRSTMVSSFLARNIFSTCHDPCPILTLKHPQSRESQIKHQFFKTNPSTIPFRLAQKPNFLTKIHDLLQIYIIKATIVGICFHLHQCYRFGNYHPTSSSSLSDLKNKKVSDPYSQDNYLVLFPDIKSKYILGLHEQSLVWIESMN